MFKTTKPKSFEGQAPCLMVIVFMRGQLIHTYTRMYFEDEESLNKTDEILNQVPADRRSTLMAKKTSSGYTFDIHMQGENETVFFDI
ncbi:hypothetical protein [Jiulongibacter sp. NS-SX5]|uniref:hypothetical protein n=1 Tax=Jiulongibacter sp. NS-SX5 TaxID=3463854 RepID=UPI00405835DB